MDTVHCYQNKFIFLVGDGICHDALNNEGCYYDFDDCCSPTATFGAPYCLDCLCKTTGIRTQPALELEVAAADPAGKEPIILTGMVGDQYCDDFLNIPEFNYDGGDCCPNVPLSNKAFDFCQECRECLG